MERVTFESLPEAVARILDAIERIERQLNEQRERSTTDTEKALTVKEAAEFLNLAVPTVYTMVSKGLLPYTKKSKRIYFFQAELLAYLKTGSRKSVAQITSEASQYISIKKAG